MLPTSPTEPKTDFRDFSVLIYGPTKIGKSTWCSHAEGALFLATEPGLNALNVAQVPITSWEKLLKIAKEIATTEHSYKTIVIDTIDNAYKMCCDHICQKNNVDHESDLTFGKGYALVNNEFQRVINKLAFLPQGLILISHSVDKEIETRTGRYTKIVPTLPDKARKLILGLVDLILYCDIEMDNSDDTKPVPKRVMRTKPSLNYDAGDRTGCLPETIPLDFKMFTEEFNKFKTKKKE